MPLVLLLPFLGLLVTPASHRALSVAVPMHNGLRCAAVVLQSETADVEQRPMPAELAEWGCDEELWGKIKGAKGSLRKLAQAGDETQARARLANIRRIIAEDEANPKAAAARETGKARGKAAVKQVLKSAADDPSGEQRAKEFTSARAANAKAARPLKDGYELVGSFPEGFDGAAAEALVKDRVTAKIARDFETADALQVQLEEMGVRLNDRRRTWSVPEPSVPQPQEQAA